MAKMTLLEMTQDILNDMDSDEVNSIDDTTESLQVAAIIKTTYFRLVSSRDWPFLRTLTALTGLGDAANPTKMQMPENMNKVLWIKYDGDDVMWLSPYEFRTLLDARAELAGVVNSGGYVLNRKPIYWTTYDDNYVYFDGYDSAVDSTMQQSKCVVFAVVAPAWTVSDSFVPLLPEKMFPTLVADAKGTAFLSLKQQANAKEESEARRGKTAFQNEAWRANDGEPNYITNSYGRR